MKKSLYFESVTDIFNKMYLAEDCNCCDCEDEDIEDDLEDEFGDLEELDDDLEYTAEMVVVFQNENRYLVEYDNLYKLMESLEIDEKQALIMVCESNNIPLEETYIVVTDEETFKESLLEAKASIKYTSNPVTKKKKKQELRSTYQVFNNLKNKGLKVLKKKSKKKKKSRK